MADCSCNNFPASLGNVTFQPGVKVGVGTTAPVGQLHVSNGDTSPDGLAGLELSNSAAGGGNWYFRAGATGTNTPAGGLSIANDSQYALAITSWGGIGIGTNAPNSKVQVSYADSAPNGLAGLEISNTAAGGGNWYIRSGATGTNTPAGGLSIANDSIYGLVITSGGTINVNGTGAPNNFAGPIFSGPAESHFWGPGTSYTDPQPNMAMAVKIGGGGLGVNGPIAANSGILFGGTSLLGGNIKDSTATHTLMDAGGAYYAS